MIDMRCFLMFVTKNRLHHYDQIVGRRRRVFEVSGRCCLWAITPGKMIYQEIRKIRLTLWKIQRKRKSKKIGHFVSLVVDNYSLLFYFDSKA